MFLRFFCFLVTITSILFIVLSVLHIGDNKSNKNNGNFLSIVRDDNKLKHSLSSNVTTAKLLDIGPKCQNKNENEKMNILSPLKINTLYGVQKSKFAYITLIHGIDNTFSYRGFLYNVLIMR
jgi:hypothetical protein